MQKCDQLGSVYSWPSQQCQLKAKITSAPTRTACFYALTLGIANRLNKFLGIVRQSGWLYLHLGFMLELVCLWKFCSSASFANNLPPPPDFAGWVWLPQACERSVEFFALKCLDLTGKTKAAWKVWVSVVGTVVHLGSTPGLHYQYQRSNLSRRRRLIQSISTYINPILVPNSVCMAGCRKENSLQNFSTPSIHIHTPKNHPHDPKPKHPRL